jgi:hypothetical protein
LAVIETSGLAWIEISEREAYDAGGLPCIIAIPSIAC